MCSFLIVVVGVVAVHVFFLGFAWVAGLVGLCWFGVAFWLCCWSQADVQEDVEVLLGEFVSGVGKYFDHEYGLEDHVLLLMGTAQLIIRS